MKGSRILETAVGIIIPLMLLLSFFLLLRGHNEPGGGFVGGLVAASAYALYAIAHNVSEAQKLLRTDPVFLIGTGLAIAVLSGMIALFHGKNLMTGLWLDYKFPLIGKVGTPLMFDLGVYFVVIGISLKIIFTLAEGEE